MPDSDDHLLDYTATALLLNIPVGTLYSMVHRRQIPHHRLGKRTVRFRPSALRAWLDAHTFVPETKENARRASRRD